MKKNAFLIIAHNEWSILKKTIELLDHIENDIYLHVDLKVGEINEEEYRSCLKFSNLFFVDRISCAWGGDSQIKCVYKLLESATKNHYEYYHLISGVDLPIKNIEYINQFFEKNEGVEFIGFDPKFTKGCSEYDKIRYYYPFQNMIGNTKRDSVKGILLRILQKSFIIIQKVVKVNRLKNVEWEIQKGPNWIDITHEFAMYVLSVKDKMMKLLANTSCGDEFLMQTIIVNSPFREKVSNKTLRHIDWNRGKPYVFKNEDFDELVSSDALFARKFSTSKDSEIIDNIYSFIKSQIKE